MHHGMMGITAKRFARSQITSRASCYSSRSLARAHVHARPSLPGRRADASGHRSDKNAAVTPLPRRPLEFRAPCENKTRSAAIRRDKVILLLVHLLPFFVLLRCSFLDPLYGTMLPGEDPCRRLDSLLVWPADFQVAARFSVAYTRPLVSGRMKDRN